MKLRTKIILFFNIISISLAFVVFFYINYSLRNSFTEEIENNLHLIAEQNESTFFAFIDGLKIRTVDWSSDGKIREFAEKIVDPTLSLVVRKESADAYGEYMHKYKLQYDPSVVIAGILDKTGVVVASSRATRVGSDQFKNEKEHQSNYFSKTITSSFREAFSREIVFEPDESENPMFHVTTRIASTKLDAKGNLVLLDAVLLMHFDVLQNLAELLSGDHSKVKDNHDEGRITNKGFIQSFKTSEVYIVNKDRTLLTSTRVIPQSEIKNRVYVTSKPIEDCFKDLREYTGIYTNYRGVKVVGSSMCLANDGLVMINEMEIGEAFVVFDSLVNKTIIIGLSVFLICLLLIVLFSRDILKRFFSVIEVSEKVSQGDFSKRVPTSKGNDEINYLSSVFNKMLDTISDTYQKLEINNKNLNKSILDIKKSKEKLEFEEARLQTILASIEDGVVLIDENYRIILANKKISDFFAMKNKEIIDKDLRTVMKIWKKKTNELALEDWPIEKVFSSKQIVSTTLEEELSITTDKHNVHISVEFYISPLDICEDKNDKACLGGIIVIHDVTSDQLLDKAKSEFISVASHQLRTPLTSVKWFSEMLVSKNTGELNEAQRDFVSEIQGGVDRLSQTIELLLGISRIESGKTKNEKENINLTDFTMDIKKETGSLVDEKKIDLSVIPPLGDGVVVFLDKVMLRQIILNLFSNAIRYTNDSGKIEAKWSANENEIVYEVKDNGIGIPEAEQANIFAKFFRANNAIVKVPDGSGLGLCLVKELVESFGGKVWFETEEGKGTSFFFTIPKDAGGGRLIGKLN